MSNRATKFTLLWCFIVVLFCVVNLSAQQKWSKIDERASKIVPNPSQGAREIQSVKEYNPPPGKPTLVRTPKGVFTVNPSFRVHPTTWSTQSEVPITRHPHNPNIMYGSANSVNNAITFISEGMYLTTDGGTTWFGSDTTASSPLGDHSGDPAPAITPGGTLVMSYLLGNGIGVSVSTNMGTTWAATTPLQTGSQDKNHTFVDDIPTSPYYGRIYVTWSNFTASLPPATVSYSTNNGTSWSTAASVATPDASHYHQGVNGVVGVDGAAYIFYQNPVASSPFTGDFMGMAKSTNGGATWTANNNIYNCNGARGTISSKGSIRINDFPSAAIDKSGGARNGWIYVVTAEKNLAPAGSDDDIIMHRSSDNGQTWSAGIRVNQDASNNGKIQYMPWVCVDDFGGVNVIYYDDRQTSSDSAMVYVSRSLDGGATWTDIPIPDSRFKPAPISGLASGYQGDYIGITSGNGKIWPYWASNKSGTYQAWITSITTTENFGFVEGTITSGGNPLSNVTVDFTDAANQLTGSSAANGLYFAGAKVDTPGSTAQYTLRARKFGYNDYTSSVTLTRNDTVTHSFSMTPAAGGTLSIYSHNNSSAPIRSNVKVKFNGTEVVNEYTDSITGMFSTPLPVGTYDVTVDPPSPYATRSFSNVAITEANTTSLDVLVRAVVETTPLALTDTLGVGQSNSKNLTLTNTTPDSVTFRISNDEALAAKFKVAIVPKQKIFADNSPSKDPYLEVAKGGTDPRFGPDVIQGSGGPDAFGYTWIDSDDPNGPTYNWIDISATGTVINQSSSWVATGTFSGYDEGYIQIPLPFTFPFYNGTYTSAYVGTNGYLSFQAPTGNTYTNAAIPTAGGVLDNFVAGWWDDLQVSGSAAIYYGMSGSDFVVQFSGIYLYSGTAPNYTYEYILKPNGEIIVQYQSMGTNGGTTTSASVGLENSGGTIGLQMAYNASYVHNNLALQLKVRGVDWLTHTPASGVIPPGGNAIINNSFDATGLTPGTQYTAKVMVDATHPDISGTIFVPASLQVEALGGPGINVSPLTKAFGGVIINSSKTDSVKIRNIGSQQLDINGVSSSNAQFTTQLSSSAIQPGDSAKLYIIYSPIMPPSTATGSITILSNDPLNGTVQVSVTGNGIGVPHFTSATTLLDKTLEGGTKDSIQFSVNNNGTLDGNYKAQAVMYSSATNKSVTIPVNVRTTQQMAGSVLLVSDNPGTEIASSKGADPQPQPNDLLGVSSSRIYRGLIEGGFTVDTVAFASHDPASYANYNLVIWSAGANTATMFNDAAKRTALVNRALAGGKVWVEGGEVGFVYRIPTSGSQIDAAFRRIILHDSVWLSDVTTSNITSIIPSHPVLTTPNALTLPLTMTGTGFGPRDAMRTIPGDPGVTKVTGWTAMPDSAGLITWANNGIPTTVFTSFAFGSIVDTMSAKKFAQNIATYLIGSGGGVSGPWLSVAPGTGSIPVSSSAQLTATFDATSENIYNDPGDYYGRIAITATNSALAESLNIPVHMFVIPAGGARLTVSPDSLGFGNVEIGQNKQLSFLVKNIGSGSLEVTGINSTNGNFAAVPTSFTLASLDTQRVTVTFTAPSPGGTQSGTLSFTSNDALAPTVKLGGRSVGTAHISASPDSMYVAHPSGPDTLSQNLTVQNTGTDTLRFTIDEAGTSLTRAMESEVHYEPYQLAKGADDPRTGGPQLMGAGGPDGFGYRWMDSDESGGPVFNWVDISSTGTMLDENSSWTPTSATFDGFDEGYIQISLSSPFSFYGTAYTSLYIGTNGYISFQAPTSDTYTNPAIPTAAGSLDNFIAGWWDDLEISGTAKIYYGMSGSNFVVQFVDIPLYNGTVPNFTYEYILKPTGEILCQYLSMSTNGGTLTSATVGIENAGGTTGLQVAYNAAYMHNNLALRFTSDLYPWLSTNVSSGTLAPGQSQTIQVRTHPGISLPAGTYNGRLSVAGNTPDVENLSVRMDVTGGTPYIQVTTPNGGESFVVNQTYNITWSKNLVDSVNLEYSTDGGSTWTLIAGGIPALSAIEMKNPKSKTSLTELMGTYTWTIPNAPTTQGRVRVSDKNNASINDMSNGNFTITSAPPATWASLTSGTTSALYAVSIVDNQFAWVGGDAGVILRTTNGGTNWAATAVPLAGEPIHNIFAVSSDVAFVTVNPAAGNDGRIYRTTNGGTGWSLVYQNTTTGAFLDAVYMFDATNGTAMGDPVNGQWLLLRTTNGGATWFESGTVAQAGTEAGWNNSFEWRDANKGWFGTNNSRMYYTTNGGTNWLYSATPAANSYGVSFISDQLGMLGAATGASAASTNGGTSWSAAATIGSGAALFPAGVTVPTPRFWMANGTTIYKSTNQGTNWTVDHSRAGVFNHLVMKAVTSAGVIVGYGVGAAGQISKYTEYLPVTSGTISGTLFEDLDADSMKDAGEPGLSGWKVLLSGAKTDSTTTNTGGAYSFSGLNPGTYTVTQRLQNGWYRSLPASGSYTINLTEGQTAANNNFGNYRLASVSGKVYEDANGDSASAGDAGIGTWKVYLSGAKSDSVVTDTTGNFTFSGLRPGAYTLSQQLKSGWVRTQPTAATYQKTLVSGDAQTGNNFGNFKLGAIAGMVWLDFDNDGVKDPDESGAPNWTINAVGAKPSNTYQTTTDANGTYSFANLFADTYTVSEVVQSGYTQTHPSGGTYSLFVHSSETHSNINFGNFSSDTSKFRTFLADSITFARDAKGKIGKQMAKTANRVSFKFRLTAPSAALHFLRLDFSFAVSAKIYRGTSGTDSIGVLNGKRFGPVNLPVANGETVEIVGFGSSGKKVKVSYQWNNLPKSTLADNQFLQNQLGLPLPNTINLLTEMYGQGAFGSNGLKVGVPVSGNLALRYGWAQITKLADALKSFYDGGRSHTGNPSAFDVIGTKIFSGKQTSVSPKKHNNKLFAELAALRINIVASAANKTPNGFGDLVFDDGSDNEFCGKSVIQIAAAADSFITFGTLMGDAEATKFYTMVKLLNSSFSGPMDTVTFGSKLVVKGARRLSEVPYLHLNETGDRTVIAESDYATPELPVVFNLGQNYPNPFNPSTTISFALPEEGIVTLKIYDVLGREVASLVNHEAMDAGEYEMQFNATNLVSGVYFYRITVDVAVDNLDDESASAGVKTFTDVKKLLLMK